MYSMLKYCILYFKVAKRVGLKSSHHKKNLCDNEFYTYKALCYIPETNIMLYVNYTST